MKSILKTLHYPGYPSCLTTCIFLFLCLSSWQSKRKFERECKEAEKSQINFDRLDNDINATKSEVEKVGRAHLQLTCYQAFLIICSQLLLFNYQ